MLFSRWNWSSANTLRKMSWVRMCCKQHLPHVGLGYCGADAAVTKFEEPGDSVPVVGVALLGLGDGLAQVFQHGGQVGLELLLRLPKLLDLSGSS